MKRKKNHECLHRIESTDTSQVMQGHRVLVERNSLVHRAGNVKQKWRLGSTESKARSNTAQELQVEEVPSPAFLSNVLRVWVRTSSICAKSDAFTVRSCEPKSQRKKIFEVEKAIRKNGEDKAYPHFIYCNDFFFKVKYLGPP